MTGWLIFIIIWAIGVPAVIQVFRDAKKNGERFLWVMCACGVLSFILLPVDRYLSEKELDADISKLQQKIEVSEKLQKAQENELKIITAKNSALETQVGLLNSYRKKIIRIGLNVNIAFSVGGQQPLRLSNIRPNGSPPYGRVDSLITQAAPFLFYMQDNLYTMKQVNMTADSTEYQYAASLEVPNSGYPVGEGLEELKKYKMLSVYIPFLTGNQILEGDGRRVQIHKADIEIVLNGKKVKKRLAVNGASSYIGSVHYADQSFWIPVSIILKRNLYEDLKLAQF
ncbi:hypothetical protein [Bdellovibrio sp.]|uniref:hypothetical protein n=1 Tax=Bdellovibrio sp. TaxID=28201 RepID=UPI003221484E